MKEVMSMSENLSALIDIVREMTYEELVWLLFKISSLDSEQSEEDC